jgi:nitric oxide reductase NorD protein
MPRPTGLAARGRALWRRWRPVPEPPVLRLEQVRRRLEILLAAVYGQPIPIVPAEPPQPPRLLTRVFFPEPGHLRQGEILAGTDAERVHLPPVLDAAEGEDAALARYRLLAVTQAERLARGTARWAPDLNARWNRHLVAAGELGHNENFGRVRDLYLLLESAAVDAAVVRAVPGLAPALQAERARALAARPSAGGLTAAEREMESLVRRLLSTSPGQAPPELAPGETPADSLRRARALAAGLPRGRYRGVRGVSAWGAALRWAGAAPGPLRVADIMPTWGGTGRGMGFGGGGATAPDSKTQPGKTTMGVDPLARDRQQGKTADPRGTTTMDADAPADDVPDAADTLDALDAPPPAEGAATGAGEGAGGPGGGGGSGSAPSPAAAPPVAWVATPADGGVPYPEWNHDETRYESRAAWVRPVPPHPGDEAWASAVLDRQGALVRRLRERFERMRAQRTRLMAQRRGDELDLAACVRAMVDLRTGHAADDRLYADVRPARRGLSITLLVDVSGSTDELVGKARIIDIEKVALLLTSEALDALGDLYSILTFSSLGADDVRVRTVKDFGERNGKAVRARIGALRPEGYTRMGAAIRHATGLLGRTHSGHRLLLILSDGKPNDRDHYQGTFAIEDARQAIAEARAAGVHPFCLTVDTKGSAYLTRIFGPAGHVVLRHPDQLPRALIGAVREILASG